ncbi:hypothetical protein BU16DRAFT_19088 [Lophium mytilinum]|uniref:Uncharacterized protein n=1 Tax=Lophium mytilinum TaxID=390894 RepID=A0A6A6REI4_9PEZI|nr:hypothetical protein BU16DRAFT_19088 [Lophium mytilinum]
MEICRLMPWACSSLKSSERPLYHIQATLAHPKLDRAFSSHAMVSLNVERGGCSFILCSERRATSQLPHPPSTPGQKLVSKKPKLTVIRQKQHALGFSGVREGHTRPLDCLSVVSRHVQDSRHWHNVLCLAMFLLLCKHPSALYNYSSQTPSGPRITARTSARLRPPGFRLRISPLTNERLPCTLSSFTARALVIGISNT